MGYRPVGQFTLLATCLVTFLVTWMKRSSMWSTMLQILSTRLLSFLHAGLVPRLILRARMGFCWREENLAEFWAASLSTVLNDKAGVVSRVSPATGGAVRNFCANTDLHHEKS